MICELSEGVHSMLAHSTFPSDLVHPFGVGFAIEL